MTLIGYLDLSTVRPTIFQSQRQFVVSIKKTVLFIIEKQKQNMSFHSTSKILKKVVASFKNCELNMKIWH